jgi:ribosomal protein S27AE
VAGSGTLAERLATGEELGLAPGVILWEETVPAEPAPPPEEEAAVAQKPPPPRQPASNLRVLGVKGGTISSQDGKVVKFRKICLRCGYADTSMTTMPIRKGTTRVNFFCPKCRKSQQSEVTGAG